MKEEATEKERKAKLKAQPQTTLAVTGSRREVSKGTSLTAISWAIVNSLSI